MKVLVTGGCGFIGSHVCEFYRGRGASVISYDNMTKVELQRTQYSVERARNHNWDYLKQLGVTHVIVFIDKMSAPRLAHLSEHPELSLWTADKSVRIYVLQ